MGVKPVKDLKEWLNDSSRKKGFNKYNLYFLREFKQADVEFAVNNQLLYFLVVKAGVFDNSRMMVSGRKQRNLINVSIRDLKTYELRDTDIPMFKKTLKSLKKRIIWVTTITKENIRLTKYHPYFEAVGYERLIEYAWNKCGDPDLKWEEELLEEIEEYNNEHQELIEEHLASVAKEIEIRDSARKKRAEATKAEKEMAKLAKKVERDEIKEMKKYRHQYEVRERKLYREIEGTDEFAARGYLTQREREREKEREQKKKNQEILRRARA